MMVWDWVMGPALGFGLHGRGNTKPRQHDVVFPSAQIEFPLDDESTHVSADLLYVEAAVLQLLSMGDPLGILLVHHLAVEEVHRTIGHGRVTRIVRHHADRRPLVVQFLHEVHDRTSVLRVEVTRRLVR